jgi:hypothetical protein
MGKKTVSEAASLMGWSSYQARLERFGLKRPPEDCTRERQEGRASKGSVKKQAKKGGK